MKNVDIKKIEGFLEATGWGDTRFGRAAVGDPRLVSALRAGRMMTEEFRARIAKFMVDHTEAEAKKVAKLRRLVK